jgi:hypothetical protein
MLAHQPTGAMLAEQKCRIPATPSKSKMFGQKRRDVHRPEEPEQDNVSQRRHGLLGARWLVRARLCLERGHGRVRRLIVRNAPAIRLTLSRLVGPFSVQCATVFDVLKVYPDSLHWKVKR